MNLLHFLHLFQEDLQISIGIAHINHKQRIESEIEEDYLRQWANNHSVPIYISHFEGIFLKKLLVIGVIIFVEKSCKMNNILL